MPSQFPPGSGSLNLFHNLDGAAQYFWVIPFYDLLDIQADLARFELNSLGSTVVNPHWGNPRFASLAALDFRPVRLLEGQRASSPAIDNANPFNDLARSPEIPNLITNGLFAIGTSGWTTNLSGISLALSNSWQGDHAFSTGVDRLAFAEQTVDLLLAGFTEAELDSGTLAAIFGGRARVQGNPTAVIDMFVRMTLLDEFGDVLDVTTARFSASNQRWVLAGGRTFLPSGVRQILLRFEADLDVASDAIALFNGAFLELHPTAYAPDHGAFGHTAHDRNNNTTAPRLVLRSPDLYKDWERNRSGFIRWETFGNDTQSDVKIDLYQDGVFLLTIAAAAPDTGSFTWIPFDDSGIDFGTHGLQIRLELVDSPFAFDMAAETFSVPESGIQYYVNTAGDTDLSDNLFTTAAGSNRNTGKTPDAPKPSPVNILRVYELGGGNELFMDPGEYLVFESLQLSSSQLTTLGLDSGFILRGAGASETTLVAAITFGEDVILDLFDADQTQIRDFGTHGGATALRVGSASDSVTVDGFRATDPGLTGVLIGRTTNLLLRNAEVTGAGQNGFRFQGQNGLPYDISAENISATGSGSHGLWLNRWGTLSLDGGNFSQNAGSGIFVESGFVSPVVLKNLEVVGNAQHGIQIDNNVTIEDSLIANNGANGIHGFMRSFAVRGTQITGHGIGINNPLGTVTLEDSVVTDNGTGIVTRNLTASGNDFRGNTTTITGVRTATISNTVIADTTLGINSDTNAATSINLENMTFALGSGLAVRLNAGALSVGNSIFSVGNGNAVQLLGGGTVSSDYNLFFFGSSGGVGGIAAPTLEAWRGLTGGDANSLVADPLFVDPANGNYRLQSVVGTWDPETETFVTFAEQSPAIDRGDPNAPVGDELPTNGGIRNLGAYGGTAQASLSPAEFILVNRPPAGGRVILASTVEIQWISFGFSGNVTVELSPDGPEGNFFTLASDIPDTGVFSWNVDPDLLVGADYALRITSVDSPSVFGLSAPITVAEPASEFFINIAEDPDLTDNVFTTAAGNDANDGLTAATPMATLAALLAAYDLKEGDIVFMDIGTYTTVGTITFASNHAGVRIVGAGPGLTELIYTAAGTALRILDAPGVTISDLSLTATSSASAISFEGTSTGGRVENVSVNAFNVGVGFGAQATGGAVVDSTITGAGRGVNSAAGNLLVEGNTINLPDSVPSRFAGIAVEAPAATGIVIAGNTVTGYNFPIGAASVSTFGIYVDAASYVVEDNTASNNVIGFFLVGGGTSSNNLATSNSYFGFDIGGSGTHDANTATNNATGFRARANFTGVISGSLASNNTLVGIHVAGGTVSGNTVVNSHDAEGIRVEYQRTPINNVAMATPSVVSGNTISGGAIGIGIRHGTVVRDISIVSPGLVAASDASSLVTGNVIHGVSQFGVLVDGRDHEHRFEHNTVHVSDADAFAIVEDSLNVTLRSNILSASGAGSAALRVAPTAQRGFEADYNLYHATGGADAVLWQTAFNDRLTWHLESGFDAHSLFADPLFEDAASADFSLAAESPARAAADPASNLLNIGASQDELESPAFRLTGPQNDARLLGGQVFTMTWQALTPSSGTVNISYSPDGGATWVTLASGTPDDGVQAVWIPVPTAPVFDGLLRISDAADPTRFAQIAVTVGVPTQVFHADESGSYANTGTTAADPLPSLAALVHAYDLQNATVLLGGGDYETIVTLALADGLLIQGSGAVLDRDNLSTGSQLLALGNGVVLQGLELANAALAVEVPATALLNGVIFTGNTVGLHVTGDAVITGAEFRDNGTGGMVSGSASFTDTLFENNTTGLDVSGTAVLNGSSVTGGDTGARVEGGTLAGGTFVSQALRGIHVQGTANTTLAGLTVLSSLIGVELAAGNGTHRVLNIVFSGNDTGFRANGALGSGGAVLLLNNTFHAEDATHVHLTNTPNARMLNNIFAGTGSTAIEADTASSFGFISNYGLFAPELERVALWQDTAFDTLSAFRTGTGLDPNSIAGDPLFVDTANGNFRLQSGSPAIDAGDPSIPVGNEPAPNGGRANLGAYGTTAEATPSDPLSVNVTSPAGNERAVQGGTLEISWDSDGFGAIRAVESYRDAVLALSPVAYLNFDGAINGLTYDYSTAGPSLPGTLFNGVLTGGPGAFTGSGAAVFDGLDDGILLPGYQQMIADSQFAISVWVYAEADIQNNATIVSYHNPSNTFVGFRLQQTNGQIVFSIRRADVSNIIAVAADFDLETWTHVTAVMNASGLELYLDGQLAASAAYSNGINANVGANLFEVGGNSRGGGSVNAWSGRMDELALFDRPLTAAEIAGLYAARTGAAGANSFSISVNGQFVATAVPDIGTYTWAVPSNFPVGPATITLTSSAITAESAPFLVVNGGPNYYINNETVVPGGFTTAPGDDANSGKSPDAPMRNLSELLRLYDLQPGDIIHIDAGTYVITDEILITALDAGVTLRGPDVSVGVALFDRANRDTGTAVFRIQGADDVTLENLHVTGADIGIVVEASSGFTLRGSMVFENRSRGLSVDTLSSGAVVENNEFYGVGEDAERDQTFQIRVEGNDHLITGNTVYLTGIANFSVFASNTGIYSRATTQMTVSGNTVFNVKTGFNVAANMGDVSGNLARDNWRGFSLTGNTSTSYLQVFDNVADDNQEIGFLLFEYVETYGNLARQNDIGMSRSGTTFSPTRMGTDDGRGGNVIAFNRIGINPGRSSIVQNNVIYGNTEDGIYLPGLSSAQILGNRIYSNGNFGIGSATSGSNNQQFQTIIENNLVYDNGNGGISYFAGNGSDGNPNQAIRNNTIVQDSGIGIRVTGIASTFAITNNIIVISAGDAIRLQETAASTWPDGQPSETFVSDRNLVHLVTASARFGALGATQYADLAAWQAGFGRDMNSIEGDPLFVDPDGADNILGYDPVLGIDGGADDLFDLRAGSPAIDAGFSLLGPHTDILGAERRPDPGTPNTGELTFVLSQPDTGSVFDAPLGGDPLNIRGNNISQEITLPFTFTFFGVDHNSVWVSSNGLMQFGSSSNINFYNNSNANLTFGGNPRITALWTNLNTGVLPENDIYMTSLADRVIFRWDAVNPADGNSPVNFAVTLFIDGSIRFDYGEGNENFNPTHGATAGFTSGSSVPFRTRFTDASGLTHLGNHPSTLMSWAPGFTDIGAFEFMGDSDDTTPPTVVAITPSQIANEFSLVDDGTLTQITVTFSEAINQADLLALPNYELMFAGASGVFGDADDTPIAFTLFAAPGNQSVTLVLDEPLGAGNYRFTLFGDEGLRDLAGFRLDGDYSEGEGGNYVRHFSVNELTDPTLAGDISGSGDEDAGPVTGTLIVTDGGGSETFTHAVTSPAFFGVATVNPTTGVWSYTPNPNYNGPDVFTVTVTGNRGNFATQVITLDIAQVNDPAEFSGDLSGEAEEGQPIQGVLVATDPIDGMIFPNYRVTTAPANGTATIGSISGAWTYTPAPGFSGSDSFFVSVTDDDGNVESVEILITVTPYVPAAVVQVVVNEGETQRSFVTSVDVVFSRDVGPDISGDSVRVQNLDSGDWVAATVTWDAATLTATLEFDGLGLADGAYLLVIDSGDFAAPPFDGDDDGLPGGVFTHAFHRLFGDSTGTGIIDNLDILFFQLAFGSSECDSNYNPVFDGNGDGTIDATDQALFFGNIPTWNPGLAVIEEVVINSGSIQRSMLSLIEIRFDRDVLHDVSSSTVRVFDRATGSPVTSTRTWDSANHTLSITFPGGSLPDGLYTLVVDGDAFASLDANGDGNAGGIHALDFHRLFGDMTGDGFISNLDLALFLRAYNRPFGHPDYQAALDADGSGEVGTTERLLVQSNLPLRLDSANNAPLLLRAPASQTAAPGGTVSLSVVVLAPVPVTVVWSFGATELLAGLNFFTFTLEDLEPADFGEYSVEILSATGDLTPWIFTLSETP